MKDKIERIAVTFVEGFMTYAITYYAVLQSAIEEQSTAKTALLSLLSGAVAAGISAVYNGFIRPWLSKKNKNTENNEGNEG